MDKEQCVRGFKVFNADWICNPRPGISKQYTCPGRFQEDGEIEVCGHGMHFCKKPADCFGYYDFNPAYRVAEVVARGEVKEFGNKCCTNDLEIVKEISIFARFNAKDGWETWLITGVSSLTFTAFIKSKNKKLY